MGKGPAPGDRMISHRIVNHAVHIKKNGLERFKPIQSLFVLHAISLSEIPQNFQSPAIQNRKSKIIFIACLKSDPANLSQFSDWRSPSLPTDSFLSTSN